MMTAVTVKINIKVLPSSLQWTYPVLLQQPSNEEEADSVFQEEKPRS